MKFPRIVLAGIKSGVGKTTLSLGIMKTLKEEGMKVQPFKIGPDYVDTGLHKKAAGLPSHNLDGWMGSDEVVKSVFLRNARDQEINIIEGVMGLFDGCRQGGLQGSTAQIAVVLKSPVVLIVDLKGMGKSCVPMVKGFKEYLSSLKLEGVIFNRAQGSFQTQYLPRLLSEELGVKVLGALPIKQDIKLPERHLGLVPAEENDNLERALSAAEKEVRANINIRELLEIARNAPELDFVKKRKSFFAKTKIAVAMDEAFNFYYKDSLDYLEELGAELFYFSPLHNKKLPQVDGIYLGGGFPEIFLEKLSSNFSMRKSIYRAVSGGIPLLAESGGMMYLAEEACDFYGNSYSCAGVIPARVEMTKKLQALGYVKATAIRDNLTAAFGETLKGHEFHYSRVIWREERYAFTLEGGKGEDHRKEGYAKGNLLASYLHLHLRSNPGAAKRFLKRCLYYKCEEETGL